MAAAPIRFAIRDQHDAIVAEVADYPAARFAARYLLESGELEGPLSTTRIADDLELELATMTELGVVWRTTQGLRARLEVGVR